MTHFADVATIHQIAEVLDVDVNLLMSDAADSATAITVEDNRFLMRRYLTVLEQALPNARCYGFERASEALKFAHSNKVDIAFLDIEMPVINGIQLAKSLKRINPQINIIFVTAYNDYAPDAYRLHASGYLSKPVDAAKVKEEVENLRYPVAFSGGEKLKIKCFGNFEIFF